jgi:hypothetical protein
MTDTEQNTSSGPLADHLAPQTGVFKLISKYIPYFRDPKHVLLFKLDCLLLTWAFIAGYGLTSTNNHDANYQLNHYLEEF